MPDSIRPVVVPAQMRRDHLREKTVEGLHGLFPLIARDSDLHVENIRVKPAAYSSNDQKKAILHGRSLAEPVVGDLVLRDKSGKVIDTKKNHILAHLPYFTERHSFIIGGNEYEVPSQLRLKPGVYTRERGNGAYEAAFNLAKGSNFRIAMEPETGKLRMELGTSSIPLRPVLRALGVSDSALKQTWGAELFDANKAGRGTTDEAAVAKLVNKLKRPRDEVAAIPEARQRFLSEYYASTRMDPEVTARTLGTPFDKVTPQALLAASQKLIQVHRGEAQGDDRDSLEFKTLHTVDDFFKERLEKDARKSVVSKLKWRLNQGKDKSLKEIVPNSTFTRPLNSFLTTSALSAVPTGYNPMEIIDHASKITSLGEGGISSDRAIPFESRKVHATHLGILDPVRTPECYDDQTEVFTSQGWMRWQDVTKETKFACRVQGKLSFHTPTSLYAADYRGPMLSFVTRNVDLVVTPNHRMFVRRRRMNAAWSIETAEQTFHAHVRGLTSRHRVQHNGPRAYVVPGTPVFRMSRLLGTLPDLKFSAEDWAEFLGWYVSEGHVVDKIGRRRVYISQSEDVNTMKCDEIRALLTRMGLSWNQRGRKDAFYICSKQLVDHLKPLGKSHEKYLPEYVFHMSSKAQRRLLHSLMLGDGHQKQGATPDKLSRQTYTTCSYRLANDVARLAAILGLPVHIRTADAAEEHHHTVYRVCFLQSKYNYLQQGKSEYAKIDYEGKVYCATVPGGLLYVRRNGSVPVWCGNSGHAGIDIRAAMGAHKDRHGNLGSAR